MENWSYPPEGKDILFSAEMDLSMQRNAASRKAQMGWDRVSFESMEFVNFGYSEMPKKPFQFNNSGLEILGGDDNIGMIPGEFGITSPTCIIGSNSSVDSGSNNSNSLMETNSQDSSLIDLKLGRLADCVDAQDRKASKEGMVLSSVSPTLKAKRARSLSSQSTLCQVYCCNKDLSRSKDYHKRHRVCEVHTKTREVIVNGIKQRFCQQCSRFHLPGEFDDDKRSCRKRLAGHNERRRKPQFTKSYKFLQSYQETEFLGTTMQNGPFLFPNIIPGGVVYPERHESADWFRLLKMEDKSIYDPQFGASIGNGKVIQTSYVIPRSANENNTVNESAGVLHSGRALSLLSAQSRDFSFSAKNTTSFPMTVEAGRSHNSSPNSGLCSLDKLMQNGSHSSGRNPMGVNHIGPFMVSDVTQVEGDGFLQQPGYTNATNYCASPEHGSTVDLLQLSSHLQRVEQQRNSIQVKHENENFVSSYAM